MSSVRVTQPLYKLTVEYYYNGNVRTYDYSYYSDYAKAESVSEHIKEYAYIRILNSDSLPLTAKCPISNVTIEEVGVFDRPFAYGRFANRDVKE